MKIPQGTREARGVEIATQEISPPSHDPPDIFQGTRGARPCLGSAGAGLGVEAEIPPGLGEQTRLSAQGGQPFLGKPLSTGLSRPRRGRPSVSQAALLCHQPPLPPLPLLSPLPFLAAGSTQALPSLLPGRWELPLQE